MSPVGLNSKINLAAHVWACSLAAGLGRTPLSASLAGVAVTCVPVSAAAAGVVVVMGRVQSGIHGWRGEW